MKKQNFIAWAIDANSKEGHRFLGRYWWFSNKAPEIPVHLEGCRIALFETRQLARKALKYDKSQDYVAFPNAKVSKVKVTIEEI